MATRIQALVADVQTAAASRSKRSIAAAAGLHINSLKHLRSATWSPTIETLRRLEAVLFPPAGATDAPASANP